MDLFRKLGPYLAIEILLPGGSLVALALFLYRHRKNILERVSIWRAAIRLLDVTL